MDKFLSLPESIRAEGMMRILFVSILALISAFVYSQNKDIQVVINTDGHMANVKSLLFSPDGSRLYSVSDDKTIKVWDVARSEIIQTFRGYSESGPTGMLNSGAISSNGDFLAIGGFLGKDDSDIGEIRYINTSNGEVQFVFKGHQSPVIALDFAPNNSFLASGSTDGSIGLWSLTTGKGMQLKGHTDQVYSVLFSPDNKKLLTASYDSTAVLWDMDSILAGVVSNVVLKDHSAEIRTAAFSPDGKYIVTAGYDNRVILYDGQGNYIKLLAEIDNPYNIPGVGNIHSVSISPDSKTLVIGTRFYENINAISYALPSGERLIDFKAHNNTVMASSFSSKGLVATAGGSNRDIYIWDPQTGEIKNHLVGSGQRVWKVGSGPNNTIGIGNISNKEQAANSMGKLNKVFDLSSARYLGEQLDFDDFTSELTFYNGATIELNSAYSILVKTKTNETQISLDPGTHGRINCYSFTPKGNIAIGSNFKLSLYSPKGELLKEFQGHTGDVFSLAFSEDGRYMYSGSSDQTVRLWDLSDRGELEITYDEYIVSITKKYGEETINGIISDKGESYLKSLYDQTYTYIVFPYSSIFITNDDEWILWTKDNFYAASQRGSKNVGFHKNRGQDSSALFYTFEQFDVRLNRPDLVLEKLGTGNEETIDMYYRAYQKRLKKLGIESASKNNSIEAPVLEMKTENQVVYQSYFGLNHVLMDFEERIASEHVTINGVPLYGKNGLVTPGDLRGSYVANIMHAYLVPGQNRIQVWGVNSAGVQSNRETRYVFFDTIAVKPDLYILGIGASSYIDKDYNLKYAAKDVQDFVNLYKNNSAYGKINTLILENENVNLEEIKKGLAFLKEAKVYDHVIVYIAGHGVLDDNLDYFLATHDMDFSNPAKKGLNYGFLEDEIGSLRARTRTVFIDACHSGEIDKSELVASSNDESEVTTSTTFKRGAGISSSGVEQNNTYELMNVLFSDLRNNSGATIIASAGGNEYAYEGAEWKNGVFTYCVLKGLKELSADLDNDGSIQLSELQRYVSKEVSRLTNGLQKPTSRFENTNTDYSFWSE